LISVSIIFIFEFDSVGKIFKIFDIPIAKTRIQNMKTIDGKPEYKGALVRNLSNTFELEFKINFS